MCAGGFFIYVIEILLCKMMLAFAGGAGGGVGVLGY